MLGFSVVLSSIGVGAGTAGVSSDTGHNSADAIHRKIRQSFAKTSDRLREPSASIPATNMVGQGERIKVLPNRDLDFCPLMTAERERVELVLP